MATTIAANGAIVANGGYGALKSELQTNPQALKNAAGSTLTALAVAGRYQDCANLLNLTGAVPGTVVNTSVLTIGQLWDQVVHAEWVKLPATGSNTVNNDRQDFTQEFGIEAAAFGGVNLNDANTWTRLQDFFPTTSTTYANLNALRTRPCSRAETLFSTPGIALTWQDIGQAWLYT